MPVVAVLLGCLLGTTNAQEPKSLQSGNPGDNAILARRILVTAGDAEPFREHLTTRPEATPPSGGPVVFVKGDEFDLIVEDRLWNHPSLRASIQMAYWLAERDPTETYSIAELPVNLRPAALAYLNSTIRFADGRKLDESMTGRTTATWTLEIEVDGKMQSFQSQIGLRRSRSGPKSGEKPKGLEPPTADEIKRDQPSRDFRLTYALPTGESGQWKRYQHAYRELSKRRSFFEAMLREAETRIAIEPNVDALTNRRLRDLPAALRVEILDAIAAQGGSRQATFERGTIRQATPRFNYLFNVRDNLWVGVPFFSLGGF